MSTSTTGRFTEWVRENQAGPFGDLAEAGEQFETLEDLFAPEGAETVTSQAQSGGRRCRPCASFS